MGSNTGFLGENPIRKGKIHTSYGFYLCTQFSPKLLEFLPKGYLRETEGLKCGKNRNESFIFVLPSIRKMSLPETIADAEAEMRLLGKALGYVQQIRSIPDETLREMVARFEKSLFGRFYKSQFGELPLKYEVMKATYEGRIQRVRD